jgi:ribonucleoside-triphosphate reductase
VKTNYTEHNPSVTCQYRPDEIIGLLSWVWEHRGILGGMSFLPYIDVKMAKLPYREISAQEYEQKVEAFPNIDFSRIVRYEESDRTEAATTLACVSGLCETE